MSEVKEYQIGEKTYVQRQLKLGQVAQLIDLMAEIRIPLTPDPMDIVVILGAKLAKAVAIVLCEKDVKLKDKDMEALIEELSFELDMEQGAEIITDFFVCNPIQSLMSRVSQMMPPLQDTAAKALNLQNMVKQNQSSAAPSGSESLSSSSQKETSPSTTKSSGE